ncbi:MAG: PPC domain-containing protein, partial [Anaerolineales bacterium]|nr:PPC domain-containing protein [Anaerolineales bacterium]
IVVRDWQADDTGDYSLSLLVIPGATTSPQDQHGGVIASGETKSGSIDLEADTDAYTFTANVGATVVIQMSRESGGLHPWIDLYSPSGGDAEASAGGRSPFSTALLQGHQLAESGQYTIVVRDWQADDTGDYSLSLVVIP